MKKKKWTRGLGQKERKEQRNEVRQEEEERIKSEWFSFQKAEDKEKCWTGNAGQPFLKIRIHLYWFLVEFFLASQDQKAASLPLGHNTKVLDPLKDSMQKKSWVKPVLQLAECDPRRMLQPRHKHEHEHTTSAAL